MLQDIPPPTSLHEACPCVLETERLTLRSPTLADVKAIARLANDRRIAENARRLPHPYQQEHAVEFVRSIAENRNELVFLIEKNFVPVGMTGDAQHAPRGAAQPRGVHRFVVLAIDRRTGRTVWERLANERDPHEAGHGGNSTWASSSAVTDGQNLYAYFESSGLHAYDMDGRLVWEKLLGEKRMRNQFGEGSTLRSPCVQPRTLNDWLVALAPSFSRKNA